MGNSLVSSERLKRESETSQAEAINVRVWGKKLQTGLTNQNHHSDDLIASRTDGV